jgi:hypothetical protein
MHRRPRAPLRSRWPGATTAACWRRAHDGCMAPGAPCNGTVTPRATRPRGTDGDARTKARRRAPGWVWSPCRGCLRVRCRPRAGAGSPDQKGQSDAGRSCRWCPGPVVVVVVDVRCGRAGPVRCGRSGGGRPSGGVSEGGRVTHLRRRRRQIPVPSGSSSRVKPRWWTAWWCALHNATRFDRVVGPPSQR